jgi:hypothetical protein
MLSAESLSKFPSTELASPCNVFQLLIHVPSTDHPASELPNPPLPFPFPFDLPTGLFLPLPSLDLSSNPNPFPSLLPVPLPPFPGLLPVLRLGYLAGSGLVALLPPGVLVAEVLTNSCSEPGVNSRRFLGLIPLVPSVSMAFPFALLSGLCMGSVAERGSDIADGIMTKSNGNPGTSYAWQQKQSVRSFDLGAWRCAVIRRFQLLAT